MELRDGKMIKRIRDVTWGAKNRHEKALVMGNKKAESRMEGRGEQRE